MSYYPLGFASIFLGGILGIAGITNSSIHSVVQGNPDKSGSGSPVAVGEKSQGITVGKGGSWKQELASIASQKKWSQKDWEWIINAESGGDPKSVNKSSGAFGLGQFLPSNRSKYPGAFSTNPLEQIRADARYISERYGNPTNARRFHETNGWY